MKYKTVKEFLTWLSNCQNDIDSKYLYYTFSENGICVEGADSFEEYKAEENSFLHAYNIGGRFFDDCQTGKLYLSTDDFWEVEVEIEEEFYNDVPYQLENTFNNAPKMEDVVPALEMIEL